MSVKAVIYFTEVPEKYLHKNMGHMIGESPFSIRRCVSRVVSRSHIQSLSL
jgi:hypothetical protein